MAATEFFNTPLISDANLVSYWRLEGNSNDSKSSNNGTDSNITYSSGNGKFNQGAGCNGSTSRIAISDTAALKPTGSFTIGCWFKTTNAGTLFGSVGYISSKIYGYTIDVSSTNFLFMIGKGTGFTEGVDTKTLSSSGVTVNDGNWHLGIAMYNGTDTMSVYVDDASPTTASWSDPVYNATNYISIGNRFWQGANDNVYNGAIDDVFFFNRELTSVEIRNLYTGGWPTPAFMFQY